MSLGASWGKPFAWLGDHALIGVGPQRIRQLPRHISELIAVQRSLAATPENCCHVTGAPEPFQLGQNLFARFVANRREAAFWRPLV
jgi:hypothetical protein